MIYENGFIEYLRTHLGDPIDVKNRNIICRCPWCEYQTDKKHYHMYISTEAPIFHCFHGGCEISGTIPKLLRKISGKDESDKYVDLEKLNNITRRTDIRKREVFVPRSISLPLLKTDLFKYKELYLKKRFKFANFPLSNVKGLVFDINEFIYMNNVELTDQLIRLRDYLQTNFIGFLTEYKTSLILRNVDPIATFKHFKIKLADSPFPDFYQLPGSRKDSNTVIVGEGVFDIYTEYLFDYLNFRNQTRLYASALKGGYQSLLKSISFFEQIFRMNVVVLSDRDVDIDYYRKLKFFNGHLIDNLTIYYNRSGKDFNVTPVIPEKFVI